MDLYDDWNEIRHLFAHSRYASIASVDAEGSPHVSPIGSLVLDREPGRGFWFEVFTRQLPRNLDAETRFCAMAVDMRLGLWARALLMGRFPSAPSVRLSGVAGVRREPTAREVELFEKRVRAVRWTRGAKLLWRDFKWGREVTFDRLLPVRIGRMWPGRRPATAS
ncbi:MAG: pyridoxamine 5'-phosphate oxidase family protein [Acidobacteriota bacterium]